MIQDDGMHYAVALLPQLIEDGVQIAIDAGKSDSTCNATGDLQWLKAFTTSFQADFQAPKQIPFIPLLSKTNNPTGFVKTARGRASSLPAT